MTCIVSPQNKWQSYDGAKRGSIVSAFCMLLSPQTNWLHRINHTHYILPAHWTIAWEIPHFSTLWHWKVSKWSIWLTLHWLSLLWHLVAMYVYGIRMTDYYLEGSYSNSLYLLFLFLLRLYNLSHPTWDEHVSLSTIQLVWQEHKCYIFRHNWFTWQLNNWMFDLHCAAWCLRNVWHYTAVFIFICRRCQVYLCSP